MINPSLSFITWISKNSLFPLDCTIITLSLLYKCLILTLSAVSIFLNFFDFESTSTLKLSYALKVYHRRKMERKCQVLF